MELTMKVEQAPNKRMQPTHQPGHQICMRKFAACLAGG